MEQFARGPDVFGIPSDETGAVGFGTAQQGGGGTDGGPGE